MSETVKNFCQNVRHLRQVHNLTQKEMAGIMGISVTTLHKMEKGISPPRIQCNMLLRVCDHFQLSADEILRENYVEMLSNREPHP